MSIKKPGMSHLGTVPKWLMPGFYCLVLKVSECPIEKVNGKVCCHVIAVQEDVEFYEVHRFKFASSCNASKHVSCVFHIDAVAYWSTCTWNKLSINKV